VPVEQVAEANARFYRAFETLDLAVMETVWAHGEHVQCVHPGWPLLVGWATVRASWETIFTHTGEIRFTLSDVRPSSHGDLAWVTCTEHILTEQQDRIAVTAVLATNLFERDGDRWRMIHHHASHIFSPPAAAPDTMTA
jgi:ketosteroid isomerase-like protein